MRRQIRCTVCGRRAYALYIRQVKKVPLKLKEGEEGLLPLIKKFNPTMTRGVRCWKAVGYWCSFCGNVEIKEAPKLPWLRDKLQKTGGSNPQTF